MLGNWKLITHISSILYYIIQTLKPVIHRWQVCQDYRIYKPNHKNISFQYICFSLKCNLGIIPTQINIAFNISVGCIVTNEYTIKSLKHYLSVQIISLKQQKTKFFSVIHEYK